MKVFDPYSDPKTPKCNCSDWGMTGCHSNCAREIYIREQQISLDNIEKFWRYVDVKSQDHMDAGGTFGNGSTDVESDGEAFIVVCKTDDGTSSDDASRESASTDSKQHGSQTHSGSTEEGRSGEIFTDGKLVGFEVNGETVSIAKGTTEGRGPNAQNIKRSSVANGESCFGIDPGNPDLYAIFAKTYSGSLLPLTAKDLELGASEDAQRAVARRLIRQLNIAIIAGYKRLFAEIHTFTGTFSEFKDQRKSAAKVLTGLESKIFAAMRQSEWPNGVEWRKARDYRGAAARNFAALYSTDTDTDKDDASTSRASSDIKTSIEVARIPGPTDESVHYIPRNPESETICHRCGSPMSEDHHC